MIPSFACLLGVSKTGDGSQFVFVDTVNDKVVYKRYHGNVNVVNQELQLGDVDDYPEIVTFSDKGNIVIFANRNRRSFYRVKTTGLERYSPDDDDEVYLKIVGLDVISITDSTDQEFYMLAQKTDETFKLIKYRVLSNPTGSIVSLTQTLIDNRVYGDPSLVTSFFMGRNEDCGPVIVYDNTLQLFWRANNAFNQSVPTSSGSYIIKGAAIPNGGTSYLITNNPDGTPWLVLKNQSTNKYDNFTSMYTWTPDPGSIWGNFYPDGLYTRVIAVTSRHVGMVTVSGGVPTLSKDVNYQEDNPSLTYDYLESKQSPDRGLILIPSTRFSDSKKFLTLYRTEGGEVIKKREAEIMLDEDYSSYFFSRASVENIFK